MPDPCGGNERVLPSDALEAVPPEELFMRVGGDQQRRADNAIIARHAQIGSEFGSGPNESQDQCVRHLGSGFSSLGIRRIINLLNKGAVKAVSPWRWLQTRPLLINCCRTA